LYPYTVIVKQSGGFLSDFVVGVFPRGNCQELIINSLLLRFFNSSSVLDTDIQVPRSSNYYVQARIALADVYLKHEDNKSLYTSCYMELAQLFPNSKVRYIDGLH
jgi:hypothetical protein